MAEQIETLDQWYQVLQTTYDKWNNELENLNLKIKEKSLSIIEEDDENVKENLEMEITLLKKKVSQITPTLEKYKYYLNFQNNPTLVEDLDLIQFD